MAFKTSGGVSLDQLFVSDWNIIDRWISGPLYGTGHDAYGELGDSASINKNTFAQSGPGSVYTSVSSGWGYSLLIKNNGTLWACGYNSGRLGDGTASNKTSPAQIGALTTWKAAAAGFDHSGAVKVDGTLWMWGKNGLGGIGDGTVITKSSPIQIAGTSWIKVTTGNQSTAAIKTDGSLWVWGNNATGQLGNGTTTNTSSPIQIPGQWADVSISATTLAIKRDGTLWAWGHNGQGQCAMSSLTVGLSSPVQIGSLNSWKKICSRTTDSSSAGMCAALQTDNTLWTWGNNQYGQLGIGNILPQSSPIQILGAWKDASSNGIGDAAGAAVVHAIKTDGSLWSWGRGAYGALGSGNTIDRSSPVQVGTSYNWKQVSVGGRGNVIATTFCEDYSA